MPEHPFLDPAFLVRWSELTAAHVGPDIEVALGRARVAIDEIAECRLETVDFENTFLALERAMEELNVAWGKVTHLQLVADSPDRREAHNAMLPKVTAFFASIPLNAALWQRLKAVAESPAADALTGIHRRLLEETVKDFRQAGADLPAAKRTRLEALQSELAQLTQKYSENVLDATNAWQLVVTDERRLGGLPERAKAAARRAAEAKGLSGWRFTLHQPSQEPFMTYVEDAALRCEMWTAAAALGGHAPHDNTALIGRILGLRAESAALLGKPHFADVVLERRMAKSGERALAFISDMKSRAAASFTRECRELEEFKAQQTGAPLARLAPWEIGFWAERLRKSRYDVDEEALRPYFPLDGVIAGLFEVAHRVFGLRVTPGMAETWHSEVKFYTVHDAQGRHIGSFYADWHPRESKRGGAWMSHLITGGPGADGKRAPHLGLICGNMTPPAPSASAHSAHSAHSAGSGQAGSGQAHSASSGQARSASSGQADAGQALLTHREVETVFHEFGHLLHHLLGEVEIKSLNGVNVAWDFVELPSQIMENWCWERESLDLLARHHETGAPIPDALFEKMHAARRFRAACVTMRQVAFAQMDLLLHMRTGEFSTADDVEPQARAAIADCLIPTEPPAPTIVKRFTHIFSDPVGYAAGYYSYKWAEVLDADAFTRFKREGIFSSRVGAEFVEKILSRGNSADPAELYRAFMGRDPDLNALLQRSGLAPAA